MSASPAYAEDLAYIHDVGFTSFARESAPGLLRMLKRAGIADGRVVDLGCGSGIWAGELVAAGYDVIGVDLSPACGNCHCAEGLLVSSRRNLGEPVVLNLVADHERRDAILNRQIFDLVFVDDRSREVAPQHRMRREELRCKRAVHLLSLCPYSRHCCKASPR